MTFTTQSWLQSTYTLKTRLFLIRISGLLDANGDTSGSKGVGRSGTVELKITRLDPCNSQLRFHRVQNHNQQRADRAEKQGRQPPPKTTSTLGLRQARIDERKRKPTNCILTCILHRLEVPDRALPCRLQIRTLIRRTEEPRWRIDFTPSWGEMLLITPQSWEMVLSGGPVPRASALAERRRRTSYTPSAEHIYDL